MARKELTDRQAAVLRTALVHFPAWVGAADHGQRVTLASLHTRGFMDRKRRDGKPDVASERASCGYYYRPTQALWASWIVKQRGKSQTGKVTA